MSTSAPIRSQPARGSRVPDAVAPRTPQAGRVRRVPWGWLLTIPGLVLASRTANPMPTMAAVASLAVIVALLSKKGLPPVLVFVGGTQWLQGALMVLHANTLGVEVWTLSYSHHIESATYLTLAWVPSLAFGIWLVLRTISDERIARVNDAHFNLRKLLIVYVAWSVALQLATVLAPQQAQQVISALGMLRWAVVFAVFSWAITHRRARWLLVALVVIEVGVGFLSFFSSFKTPLYVLALALANVGYRPTVRQYVALALVGAATLYLGVIWSSVKMDYRDRLNAGSGQQTVVVKTEDQIREFSDLVGTLDSAQLSRGVDKLVERIAYVEYFSFVLDYVPGVHPHEEGRLWTSALAHVATPRFFFPEKEGLESDTLVAERYTGLNLQSGRSTSIALGLPAETYVDFGEHWMFAVAVLLGVMYGLTFRYFILREHAGLLAQGFAVATHLGLQTLESSPSKAIGGHLSIFMIAFVIWHIAAIPLMRYLKEK